MTMLGPFLMQINILLLVKITLTALKNQKLTINEDKTINVITQHLFDISVPFLLIIGFVLQTGVYANTLIKDRQDDLRYFLNFSGANGYAYVMGVMLSDCVLLMVSIGFLLIVALLIQVDAIIDGGGSLFLLYLCFQGSFLAIVNLFGMFFKDVATAYKILMIFIILLFVLAFLIDLLAFKSDEF